MKLVKWASVFLVGALAGCATEPTADPWNSGQTAYEHGDYDLALKDLRVAAGEGHGAAYTLMGHLYRDGHGVAQDTPEAVRHYTRAAELGQCAAQLSLARMYHIGSALDRDEALAERWYREAAMRGYPWAQFALASFYANGVLVRKDDVQAYFWFSALAENPRRLSNGVGLAMQEVAIKTLVNIREKMTARQFMEARDLVEDRLAGSKACADNGVIS
jgi:TPR repeat protein